MKDLMKCSIDELLTERQDAIEAGNIGRYRECNELISTWSNNTAKKLDIVEMVNDLNAPFSRGYEDFLVMPAKMKTHPRLLNETLNEE